MKPKIFVAVALMLSVLVAGLILIFGYSSNVILPVYLLAFLLIFSAMNIYVLRNSLTDKIIMTSILLILLSISATLFLTNLKVYHEIINKYASPEQSSEISLMQSQNEYYSVYTSYLNQEISAYQNQTKIMENKLEELKRLQLEKAQQKTVVTVVTPPVETAPQIEYVYYPYNENDGREVEND
jgi:hypothetical protein